MTLLEDYVLIAPAPYATSSAYYFPTFGRIRSVEILKGPASITQGPYTVGGAINLEAMFFFNDYMNLVGVCTNSSGGDCNPGDAFNGKGVHIPGLEFNLSTYFELGSEWQMPLQIVYTWMNAEFQSSFISEFFGAVQKGDPVPYVPANLAKLGFSTVDHVKSDRLLGPVSGRKVRPLAQGVTGPCGTRLV